jgi:hypothetical protein
MDNDGIYDTERQVKSSLGRCDNDS